MPAHTPSPHRFLAPNPPSTQKSKKPHSNLRNALDIQTPQLAKTPAQKPELQFRKLTPAKRFVIAPAQHKTTATDQHTTPRPKPPRKLERIESIEGSQELEPDNNDNDDDNDNDEMLFDTATRNKRRRTSPPSSPSLQDPSDPQTPAPTTHRFKVPPPRTPAPFPSIATVAAPTPLPTCASTPSSHRPHFILPVLPTSPPKPATPPPDIFSPSRKAAKYTPAGMASTVTSWILETANTAFAAQDRGGRSVLCGRDREHGVAVKVRITGIATSGTRAVGRDGVACYPGRVVFARACIVQDAVYDVSSTAHGDEEVSILLVGQGGVRGSGGVLVKMGSVLGVRVPTWHVHVQGDKCLVAVDWILL
ncbi:hypothetical protein PTNB73_04697 [Pyrenophora teres f. teres]|uniref:Uncharacterized protein n=1 Tax=Pyrenophora teres f. teres (strain 0-1) TaxID=861557 RepID=E3S3N3_PYRTT|nr:hypothetical protein PTT_17110 [Pyrenophora teres f. teres 0-1]KAE8837286.1 hypothetical protein PTNB85_04621 [Pyrenophora teres f. teres]KAE8840290.1 hypothetical protein HRS9122_06895 [Pyrenophora teres f. teres]KAE8869644.1 hypothetical protein PTNB73_04697 [Pyrenophora teres f. teres]